MYNFITNLLNINSKDIKDLKAIQSENETQFHIYLIPFNQNVRIAEEKFTLIDIHTLKKLITLLLKTKKV